MVKPYRLSPLAEADLEEIWLYTLRHWSMKQADTYHQAFMEALKGLAVGTKQGRPSVLPDFQKYLCGSHVVYFLDYADHLDVIRILHQRQDAEQHL
ncbi:type II toxin-antitoxin system RelE/ParE family toxin [Castellaniella sp.]|uniref:type II toxin-antitoxin system RelE/ParE family toxin n=1 Tax=Castellaniella sp. TaxID=1955812 RepID=UPI002AFE5DC2|nr:type II toxin-antitoxin system RelE/ParE family toxin [Castellaniella sp.]